MGFYSRHVFPRFLDCAMQAKPMGRERAKIVPRAAGRVLEIGSGSGLNFDFYDPKKVAEVIALDPSAELRRYAERRARAVTFPVTFLGLEAEEIPLEDASVDTVLTTFTLCTIPDVARALSGMRRVLKPGGELLFAEHGLALEPRVQRWQNRLTPLWKRIGGGCHLNRPIRSLIEAAGFEPREIEESYMPGAPRFAGYLSRGRATLRVSAKAPVADINQRVTREASRMT